MYILNYNQPLLGSSAHNRVNRGVGSFLSVSHITQRQYLTFECVLRTCCLATQGQCTRKPGKQTWLSLQICHSLTMTFKLITGNLFLCSCIGLKCMNGFHYAKAVLSVCWDSRSEISCVNKLLLLTVSRTACAFIKTGIKCLFCCFEFTETAL